MGMPWEAGDDERRKTDLDQHAYIEASKVWGECMGDVDRSHTWAWESFLTALRVYEFERAKRS